MDWGKIKSAYKKMAFKWHPDKNLDSIKEATEKFKQISEALSYLQEESNRTAYFHHQSEQELVSEPEPYADERQEINSQALVSRGDYTQITIYLPVMIVDYYGDDIDEDDYNTLFLSMGNLAHNYTELHAILVRKLNHYLSQHTFIQVGLDQNEIESSVSEYSWYKYYAAYYMLKININATDLGPKMAESDVSSALSAGWGDFFTLKKGARISAEDITRLIYVRGTLDDFAYKGNALACQYEDINLREQFLEGCFQKVTYFIHNTNYWYKHTGFNTSFFSSFPEDVLMMQNLFKNHQGISLDNMQKIAESQLKQTGANQHSTLKNFYQTIAQAKSLTQVVEWIDSQTQTAEDNLLKGVSLKS